jgi:2-keto-3-deoxy-L-rhamnonate aldolase RhmA
VGKSLKERLSAQELTIGSWITLAHPTIAEILANAGFDWLAVDLEHSSITIKEAEELIRVINLSGVSALVRLTNNDPNLIKRVMDSGATGIIVPNINTASEARQAVSAVRYPPFGMRGVGLARAQRWGNRFQEYLTWQEIESVVIVQIEHIDALDNLDEIFNVPGVDGCIIGPYDLSMSMGIPGQFEDIGFVNTIKRIKQSAEDNSKPVGLHVIEPDIKELNRRIDENYNFLAFSLDVRMVDVSARQINTIRRGEFL